MSKIEIRKIIIESVGREWIQGIDFENNNKKVKIKINEFFSKEKAEENIGEIVEFECEIIFRKNSFGYLDIFLIPRKKGFERKSNELTNLEQRIFKALDLFRRKISLEKNCDKGFIFSYDTMLEITKQKPSNKSQLMKINGIGETRYREYGTEILEIISENKSNGKSKLRYVDIEKDFLTPLIKSLKLNENEMELYREAKSYFLDIITKNKIDSDIISNRFLGNLVKKEHDLEVIEKILDEKLKNI